MGGIIVIDFIDMRKVENKKLIYDRMRDEMKGERAKYTILPLSKFGLMHDNPPAGEARACHNHQRSVSHL